MAKITEELINNLLIDFQGNKLSVRRMVELLNEKASEAEWIRESEHKPPFDTLVLVNCRIYGCYLATYQQIEGIWGNWHDGTNLGVLPPTHWMPLPNKPAKP